MAARLSFGITARERPDLPRLGARVEELGYAGLWANDTRAGSGLATLAACAQRTTRLGLGVGVIALSERDAGSITAEALSADVPRDRLVLGVGSGASRSLGLVRRGAGELRELLPGVAIGVAAVGPRMCRLAGEIADAAVLNWAPPERLAWAAERVASGAASAGRPAPRVVGYVRVAIGPGAGDRLADEMRRYAGVAPHYARAFAEVRDRHPLVGIALEEPDGAALTEALEPYRSVVDEVVVRGLPASDEVDTWLEIAALAAPG